MMIDETIILDLGLGLDICLLVMRIYIENGRDKQVLETYVRGYNDEEHSF